MTTTIGNLKERWWSNKASEHTKHEFLWEVSTAQFMPQISTTRQVKITCQLQYAHAQATSGKEKVHKVLFKK